MPLFSLADRPTASDSIDLRDALRRATVEADAKYAALYIGGRLAEFFGDRACALERAPFVGRSIPHLVELRTVGSETLRVALGNARLTPSDAANAIVLVGGEH